MKTLCLMVESRARKIASLYEGEFLLGEVVTCGDLLLAVRDLLQEKGLSLKDIGRIKTAAGSDSASQRVARSLERALNYALGL